MPARLPDFPAARSTRRRVGLAAHAVLAVAGLTLLALTAPAIEFTHPALIGALLAVAVVCELSEVWLASGVRLNATLSASVMALALGGPLAAFAVLLVPDIAVWALRREERLLRAGTLANLAAYGWAALAGGGMLALAHADGPSLSAAPTLVTAGLALAVVNFAVGPALYAPLQLGTPVRRMPAELSAALPAVTAMVLAGVLTTVLVPVLGLLAVAGFAFVTLVPGSALTLLARARPVADLDLPAATRLYADALGDVLRLDRDQRRLLARAAALTAAEPDPHRRLWTSVGAVAVGDQEAFDAALISAHVDERYAGAGLPAGLCGDAIPPLSRVLAVAREWARLTAAGTVELSHQEALLDLQARTGDAFDPAMVAAAGAVVERDTRLAPVPAAQPRIHAWPGTAGVRERVAPRLLALASRA